MSLAYGPWSDTKLFTLNTVNPDAPIVDPIPAQTMNSPITITGSGVAGNNVEIWIGNDINNLTATGLTATVQSNGTWTINNVSLTVSETNYIGAKQTDSAENVSSMSNVQGTQFDTVSPTAAILLSPAYTAYGLNENIIVTLTTSEPLQAIPNLSFTPNAQTPIAMTLTPVEASTTVFQGIIVVAETYADGIVSFAYNGTDISGNIGTTITSGGSFVIDKSEPYITINSGTLITNDTTRIFTGEVSDNISGVNVVKISINGGVQFLCDINGGLWTSPDISFLDGVNTITATAYDNTGLIGNAASVTVSIIHNILPYAPQFTGTENPDISNDTTPTFVFIIPADPDDALDETTAVHLWLQVAKDALFTVDVTNYKSRNSQVGWQVGTNPDGTNGDTMPINGTELYGSFASFTVPSSSMIDGNYFWRVAATDNVTG